MTLEKELRDIILLNSAQQEKAHCPTALFMNGILKSPLVLVLGDEL